MIAGRWLLAMVGDSQSRFPCPGHHRWVGTRGFGDCAPRRSPVRLVVRSVLGQLRSSFEIERNRLRESGGRSGRSTTGFSRSGDELTVAVRFFWRGLDGRRLFLVCAAYSKFLRGGQYIQHYGLVRCEGARSNPGTPGIASTCQQLFLFNLPRHAHHHLRAGHSFWELRPDPGALALESGYMAAILLAMVPPLWIRAMARALRCWDEKLATGRAGAGPRTGVRP